MQFNSSPRVVHSVQATTYLQRSRSSDDNSFQNATSLGEFRLNRAFSASVTDSVGRNDRADLFKVRSQAGVDTTGTFRLSATGKGVKIQYYKPNANGGFQLYSPSAMAKPGLSAIGRNNRVFNFTNRTQTYYFKLTPLQGKSTYKLELNYS